MKVVKLNFGYFLSETKVLAMYGRGYKQEPAKDPELIQKFGSFALWKYPKIYVITLPASVDPDERLAMLEPIKRAGGKYVHHLRVGPGWQFWPPVYEVGTLDKIMVSLSRDFPQYSTTEKPVEQKVTPDISQQIQSVINTAANLLSKPVPFTKLGSSGVGDQSDVYMVYGPFDEVDQWLESYSLTHIPIIEVEIRRRDNRALYVTGTLIEEPSVLPPLKLKAT